MDAQRARPSSTTQIATQEKQRWWEGAQRRLGGPRRLTGPAPGGESEDNRQMKRAENSQCSGAGSSPLRLIAQGTTNEKGGKGNHMGTVKKRSNDGKEGTFPQWGTGRDDRTTRRKGDKGTVLRFF